jgi:hypothetical protein
VFLPTCAGSLGDRLVPEVHSECLQM